MYRNEIVVKTYNQVIGQNMHKKFELTESSTLVVLNAARRILLLIFQLIRFLSFLTRYDTYVCIKIFLGNKPAYFSRYIINIQRAKIDFLTKQDFVKYHIYEMQFLFLVFFLFFPSLPQLFHLAIGSLIFLNGNLKNFCANLTALLPLFAQFLS